MYMVVDAFNLHGNILVILVNFMEEHDNVGKGAS